MRSQNERNRDREDAARLTRIALMSVLGLIFSYVEAIIPYQPAIPGIKLGVANLVVIIALYKLSAQDAAAINSIRIVMAGLLFNGAFAMLYSLGGATVSMAGMVILKRTGKFSIAGVSMAGGVLHNLGQIMIAATLITDLRIFSYFPVLIFSGMISGIAIGILATLIIKRLSNVNI